MSQNYFTTYFLILLVNFSKLKMKFPLKPTNKNILMDRKYNVFQYN